MTMKEKQEDNGYIQKDYINMISEAPRVWAN